MIANGGVDVPGFWGTDFLPVRLPTNKAAALAGHPGHMALRVERLTSDDHLRCRSVCTRLQPCLELTAAMYATCGARHIALAKLTAFAPVSSQDASCHI